MIEVGSLTHREAELWRSFQAHLSLKAKTVFTADDLFTCFSRQRLEEVFHDPVHDVGLFFLKLLRQGEICIVGQEYGRYNRAVKQYAKT